ncbi:MAG TPA: methyltransferase domain-containing protein [Frankiaceae bacterium]|jgi:SAM-dependent methyltransferase|nr:methyltransferase domain-containing protein [Frankiaceae bacterium]
MTDGAAAARDYADHVDPSMLPVAATLLALAGVREGEVVVDVACGTGLLTHPAAAAAGPGGRVYGVDDDGDALAVARTRRPSAAGWARASVASLPFRTGSVDKVVCGAVLHRLPDVRPAVAEWARVLAPGGRVAVGAWGSFAESAAEDAVLRALDEHGVDPAACERRVALLWDGAERRSDALPALLAEAGLRVTHEAAGDVTVPFVGAGAFAAWRLSFPRAVSAMGAAANGDRAALRASVVARVVSLLGPEAVLVHSGIHYATASPS